RKPDYNKETGFYEEVKGELRKRLKKKLSILWDEGINGPDFFVASIGAGLEVLGKYDRIIDYGGNHISSDRLLEDIRSVAADFAIRNILEDGFAEELSPFTRFYIFYRWNYGNRSVEFDEARKLANSIGLNLENKSFINIKGGRVKILGPDERKPEDCNLDELIDVIHLACIYWSRGENDKVRGLASRLTPESHRVMQAIIECLPSCREKQWLEGRGGDPVIQLQTPFGGGKTHALIALYHMARDMGANVVVLAGDAFDASEVVLWEEMERQLTGEVKVLGSETSPGVDKIRSVLVDCQPVLILVDELLEYAVKAAGRKIGDSTLASQLLAFIQELSGAVSSLDRASLVVTLPSSVLEHYDENAERLFQQLSKVLGRTEKIYAPVADDEIYSVIRRRLFKSVHKDEIRKIVDEIVEKLDSEDLLPEGLDVSDYRRAFMESYPFQPEVIDVLYERWGSFPNFQRTRGVLRLLSLVVNSLKDSNIPFIRLSDFDLSNDHIKREFIKFIGNEYDSIIASDITGPDSGSKVIDSSLKSYAPYRLGTHIATTIFLYSFSGGERNGATLEEIKRSCIETEIPMAIISDTLDKMRERLFYLHKRDGLYYFSNKPNLIRIHAARRENVTKETIKSEERRLLGQ
ncbi:MAG TPA: DUF499 domain-containing protein, partial [Thermoanaerobacterium sp.]|nr:DUF499 domain-containing protein [Thermoanaerobacterium sp.]